MGLNVGNGDGIGEGGLVGCSVGVMDGLLVGDLSLVGAGDLVGAGVAFFAVGAALGLADGLVVISVWQISHERGQPSLMVLLTSGSVKTVDFPQNFSRKAVFFPAAVILSFFSATNLQPLVFVVPSFNVCVYLKAGSSSQHLPQD